MRPMLNIAVRAARQGGSVLSRAYAQHDKVEVFQKGHSYVTKADLDSEKVVIASIQKSLITQVVSPELMSSLDKGASPGFPNSP